MTKKIRSVVEVALVVVFLRLAAWGWDTTPLAQREFGLVRWDFLRHILFALIPILILIFARRSFKAYGLDLKVNWKASLKWGVIFGAALGIPPLLALILGWQEVAVPKYWLSTLIFQMFFASFGEEILYRGYFQSRINGAFGRPWDAGGLKFGVGLIAISVLFGFAHVLNPFNPFQGQYGLDWVGGLIALQTGFFYGFVREKTGSILPSAVIHGSTFWWDFLAEGSARYIGMSIGWCISWVLLFALFSRAKFADEEDRASPTRLTTA
jgi:membrane protease YdiL (CAAX protease family)